MNTKVGGRHAQRPARDSLKTPRFLDIPPAKNGFLSRVKTCLACGDVKPVDGFSRDASRKDGPVARCRECDTPRSGQVGHGEP